MAIQENTTYLWLKISDRFASDFDILQNISILNRKWDIGFTEFSKMTIWPRPWTEKLWNDLTWDGWVFSQFMFIDFFKKEYHLKSYNKKVWRLNWDNWEDIGSSFSSNNIFFRSLQLPMNLNWSISTIYSTPGDATTSEAVKKDDNDSWWAWNIWKYLIVTDNTWNKQAYRGAYALIIDYDTTNKEYILSGSWVITQLKSWSKYQIYDTLWEYFQLSTWKDYEEFYFWKSDWTLVKNDTFTWIITKNLRNIKAITDTEFLYKNISYSNSIVTFNKNILYYSTWVPNNPFFYAITSSKTIPWNISWKITDLFLYKDRLIIAWDSYIAYLEWIITSTTSIKIVTASYWIVPWSLVELWIDGFFISTTKNIYSLKENIYWNSIYTNDEGKTLRNFLKDFNYNIVGWFDWEKIYFYWEKEEWKVWITLVFDAQFKFWSIYTWLPISSVMEYKRKVYISDNNSDAIRIFNNEIFTDLWNPIQQIISTKDIDLNKPFSIKTLSNIYLWLDNYVQWLNVKLYWALAWSNTLLTNKPILLSKEDVDKNSYIMWETLLWEWIIWWQSATDKISLPILKNIPFEADNCYIFKIYLEGREGRPFYVNELWFAIQLHTDNYFSPWDTI
jgi:hypothetical protein